MLRSIVCALGILPALLAESAVDSRAAEIEAAQKKKAAALATEVATKTEQNLVAFREKRILERITYGIGGLRARIGALVTGSGFAVGPEYFRDDLLDGDVRFRATSQFSFKKYQLYDVELAFPRLASNHAFFELHATHRNFPEMPYYGPGPDSRKTGRTDYRLEDTKFSFVSGVKLAPRFHVGATGGFTEINTGPGTAKRFASSDTTYPSVTGMRQQTDFLQGGVFAQYDYRDIPGGPRNGGNYLARYTYNKDVDLHLHTHRMLELEAQQYIPFFNNRRVIALRGRSELTYKNPGQTLPFYMQPTLGGAYDLRGFRPFRFYGDNMIVFNAEYRYEIFSGLDMAVFGDTGKVFQSKREWNLHDMEGAYGIGMRFNARDAVFMRIDAGFSHEGIQVWVTFKNAF